MRARDGRRNVCVCVFVYRIDPAAPSKYEAYLVRKHTRSGVKPARDTNCEIADILRQHCERNEFMLYGFARNATYNMRARFSLVSVHMSGVWQHLCLSTQKEMVQKFRFTQTPPYRELRALCDTLSNSSSVRWFLWNGYWHRIAVPPRVHPPTTICVQCGSEISDIRCAHKLLKSLGARAHSLVLLCMYMRYPCLSLAHVYV